MEKIQNKINLDNIENIVVSGIDWVDYPDFVDAFIESADIYIGGRWREMTEEELDYLHTHHEDWVYERIIESTQ